MSDTAPPALGSVWRRHDGPAFIVAAVDPEVRLRPIVRAEVRGRPFPSDLDGYHELPQMQSPTLACRDREAARAAVAFLREKGLRDAFATGTTVIAPWASDKIAADLRFAAREYGWEPAR